MTGVETRCTSSTGCRTGNNNAATKSLKSSRHTNDDVEARRDEAGAVRQAGVEDDGTTAPPTPKSCVEPES